MSDVSQRTREEAEETARNLGLVAIFPNNNEVQVDLDTPDGTVNMAVLEAIRTNQDSGLDFYDEILYTPSKNGNRHAMVMFTQDLSDTERVALQAALGSDPIREALSILRIRLQSEAPTVLFQKSDLAVRLWRKRVVAIQASRVDDSDILH